MLTLETALWLGFLSPAQQHSIIRERHDTLLKQSRPRPSLCPDLFHLSARRCQTQRAEICSVISLLKCVHKTNITNESGNSVEAPPRPAPVRRSFDRDRGAPLGPTINYGVFVAILIYKRQLIPTSSSSVDSLM